MTTGNGIVVRGAAEPRFNEILTPEALDFLLNLERKFGARRKELLEGRRERRRQLRAGGTLDFLPETASIRQDGSWRVAPPAPGLIDRRAEITGPTDRKMTINALNSGAKVWLADFEDANAPTWSNLVGGQLNLWDTVHNRVDFVSPEGKAYAVGPNPATIVPRPRGLHLVDLNILVDGEPISGSLMDFGLYFFHCAKAQLERGSGPYFYLPKLEHHLEARWWNDVFVETQEQLGVPQGTIRATTLIETIPAAFQMEEILYELRDHSAGLNAGRWDYLFSLIKNFIDRPEFVTPDRGLVVMTVPFMRAYTELLVRTCHKRGAHAIGGMSAFIPSRDAEANEIAFAKVRDDKTREAGDGFDGSWVAHPGLVPVCREVFDGVLGDRPNQLDRLREEVSVTAADLLAVDKTPGSVTTAGVRQNLSVALRYIDSWLRGIGAAAIDNLMEDAATAEISRCQISQWLRHQVVLEDGTPVTESLVRTLLDEEAAKAEANAVADSRLKEAREVLLDLIFSDELPEFLTTEAYARYLV